MSRGPLGARWLAALAALVAVGVTATALAATGDVSQPNGKRGCVSVNDFFDCTIVERGRGTALAASPDGRHIYTVGGGTLNTLDRARSGRISQRSGNRICFGDGGVSDCRTGRALGGLRDVIISPDGRNVYVTSGDAQGVAVFDRNRTTGLLKQKQGQAGCVTETGRSLASDPGTAGECADGTALGGAGSLAISPDGRSLYVTDGANDSIAVLDRKKTGALEQKAGDSGCVTQGGVSGCNPAVGINLVIALTVSPDGNHVYSAALNSNAVAVFDRADDGAIEQKDGEPGCVDQTGAGDCENGRGLTAVDALTVSSDGRTVYAVGRGGTLAVLERNRESGDLDQPAGTAGCFADDGSDSCEPALVLDFASNVVGSRDGRSVYVMSAGGVMPAGQGLAVFRRNVKTGALTQPAFPRGCISNTGRSDPDDAGTAGECLDGNFLDIPGGLAMSPDDRSIFYGETNNGFAVIRRDAPRCSGKAVTLMGTPLKDRLRGTAGRDVIAGLDGNDRVSGLGGRDLLCGGRGADRLDGGGGNGDVCRGDSGRDRATKACETVKSA